MNNFVNVMRIVALFISMLGYYRFSVKQLKIHPYLSWIIIFAFHTMMMWAAGFAGILVWMNWCLMITGLILSVFSLLKYPLGMNFKKFSILPVVLLALAVLFSISLLTTKLEHYDNFSHWALIVKYLNLYHAFPNGESHIISFSSYPLGSSLFVYYITWAIGHGEGVMLWGQALLIFASLCALFATVERPKRLLLAAVIALGISWMNVFNISIRINNLLVDFLLPLFALAAISIFMVYRNEPGKATIYGGLVLIQLVQIKNSAIFFAALAWVYFVYQLFKNKEASRLKRFVLGIVLIAVLVGSFMLWQNHVKTNFDASSHAIDAEQYEEIAGSKSPEDIAFIRDVYLNTVLSVNSLATFGFVSMNVLTIGLVLFAHFGLKKKWQSWKTLLWLDFAFILYYIGIYFMFIYSMPLEEALVLAGFERYASSMVVFMIGALSISISQDIDKSFYWQGNEDNYRAYKSISHKQMYQNLTVLVSLVAFSFFLSELNGMNYNRAMYPDSLPARFLAVAGDHWVKDNRERYLLIASDDRQEVSSYYLQYVGRYYLFIPVADAVAMFDDEFIYTLKRYDKLLIIETTIEIQAYFERYFKMSAQPGFYEINELLDRAEKIGTIQ